jgi:hypothetical protein
MMTDDDHKHEDAENEEGEVSDDALDEVFDAEDEETEIDPEDVDEKSAFGDDGLDE